MRSKLTLALGTALAGIALSCFVDPTLAQDALTASIAVSDIDDVDDDDTVSKNDKSRQRRSHKSGSNLNTKDAPWIDTNENRSLAITTTAGARYFFITDPH